MRRYDAARNRLADTEWIADGEHQITHLNLVGISQSKHRELLLRLDLQHREIGRLVAQQYPAFKLTPVGKRDLDFVCILDDVIIRHNNTGAINDHTGTERLLDTRLACAKLAAKELLEEGSPSKGERACTCRAA